MPRVKRVQAQIHRRLGAWKRSASLVGQYEWSAYWRERGITPHTVLYEAFSGNGVLDNPEAIFQGLLAAPDMGHLRHIWVLNDLEAHRRVVDRYRDNPRVTFVRYRSAAYFRALNTSQYLVNNATFPPEFAKRDGQIYVNTWHGTPLKRMGYDIENGGPATRNQVRNFVACDFLLSSSDFMTEQMYYSAYKLRNIFRGVIVQEGYPRIDHQFGEETTARRTRASLQRRGVELDPGNRILLYAPTWKGTRFNSPTNDVVVLRHRIEALRRAIDPSWRVLLKVHQTVYRYAERDEQLRALLVPNDIPTNAVLQVTDALITDYSSVFFDFLATGRPVLFHVPDLDTYEEQRGLYIQPQDWPGPVSRTTAELIATVRSLDPEGPDHPAATHGAAYRQLAKSHAGLEDGRATERIIDVIWRGKRAGYTVISDHSDGRESMLIYLGGMRSNGITTSALNLLDNIDHDRFDVSVVYSHSTDADRRKNEAAINPNARLFPRIGRFGGSMRHRQGRLSVLKKGLQAEGVDHVALDRLFRQDWKRCFGDSRFDYHVDFSGYGPFWPLQLLQGDARHRSIWLHNDLAKDRYREVNGKRPLEQGLEAVFSTYSRFDTLVSVSEVLSKVNAQGLAQYADPSRFIHAVNTINHRRIRDLAYGVRRAVDEPPQIVTMDAADVVTAVDAALGLRSLTELGAEVQRRTVIEDVLDHPTRDFTFVTVGRLSPEKNQERLIRAFALVHQDHPKTRLVIIGSGPLRETLERLVNDLGVVEAVKLAGQRANPYAIMAKCDCFVLSSNYEGQPMVILEARVLGLPVVTTEFASVRGALEPGVGVVVPHSDAALAEGMILALEDKVPNPPFDHLAYNSEAMRQFYRAIGAEPGHRPGMPLTAATQARALSH